jgi:hypothetical protein
VSLRVSFDEALRRVQADPKRKLSSLSRDPTFLARHYSDFAAQSEAMPSSDLVVDTEAKSASCLAAELASVTGVPRAEDGRA